MAMRLNRDEYRAKVLGCWMGKNIGGTLGAPFEWRRQINRVTFYTQDLGGEPLPNDDLDLQLIWLIALEEQGVELDAHTLAEYWLTYITPHWAEYGTAKTNLRSGLAPPLSGTVNNIYKDSCGAFIRSEIWACIAPGCPGVAAEYALQDAIVDHGDGEGTFAAVFCAALESVAFVVSDLKALLDTALSYIPPACGVAGAVGLARECHGRGLTWLEARDEILRRYRGSSAFNNPACTSEEDRRKGFADGRLGWDAPSNIGLIVLGILYGEDDFERTICTTVNCGEDTDCTGATVGSLFGILHGIAGFPDKWTAPIGRRIKTACLNLGDLGMGRRLPQDIDRLTERTERIAQQVVVRRGLPVAFADSVTDAAEARPESLMAGHLARALYANLGGPVYHSPFLDVAVDCSGDPTISAGRPREIRVRVRNRGRVQANLTVRCHAPEGWRVTPPLARLFVFRGDVQNPAEAVFQAQADRVEAGPNRLLFEVGADARPTVAVAPLTLVAGA